MDKAIEKNLHAKKSIFKTHILPALKKLDVIVRKQSTEIDKETLERRELLEDIEETLSELRYARSCFENARDPEVIEACVYEIKSAETRYSFLLRKAKRLGEKSSQISV